MAWFVVGIVMAVGTATIGLLLARVERVRIQTPAGDALAATDPTVSVGARQG